MLPGKVGRWLADRGVRVRPPVSPYFRTVGDGVIVASPPRRAHRLYRTDARARSPAGLRAPALERRGVQRAALEGQGPGRLLQRQPLVGRVCDGGHPFHAVGRRDRSLLVDRPDLSVDRRRPWHHRRLVPPDDPCLSKRRRKLRRRAGEPRNACGLGRGRGAPHRLRPDGRQRRRGCGCHHLGIPWGA